MSDKLIDLNFQTFELCEQGALRGLSRRKPLTRTPMFDQCRTVQPQPLDMKSAGRRQVTQRAIFFWRNMKARVIAQRMKNAARAAGPPVIAFEFVAGVAGVNQVIQVFRAAMSARLKMIDAQQRADIRFAHAAITAGRVEKFTQLGT